MKILFIHNYYKQAGGEDQVVANEMELLRVKGHQVELLTFDNHELQSGLTAIPSFFYNAASYQKTKAHILHFKPDLIHVHNFFYQASVAIFFAARDARIPVVLTLHNYRMVCANALLLRDNQPCELCLTKQYPTAGIRHKCFQDSYVKTTLLTSMLAWYNRQQVWKKLIQRIIVLTDFAKQKFGTSAFHYPDDKMIVKSNSVADVAVLKATERQDYYLFVGRLSQEKGILTLLEAAKEVELPIKIIGDGPLLEEVVQITQEYTHIEYLGKQAHEQVMSYIQECKALILPSICYEGLPNTLLEAYSAGTPVIASDIDNVNQLISNGENGWIFETGNGNDLAIKMVTLSKLPTVWQVLSEGARTTYEQKYSHQHNYEQLIEIYKAACI